MIPECPICGALEYADCTNTKTGKTRCAHGARMKAFRGIVNRHAFHLNQEIIKIQERYMPKIEKLETEMETKISDAKLKYGWGLK